MDNTDLKILSYLQKNGRASIKEISGQVNLSSPAVTERIKRLEESGVIDGYAARIDPIAVGLAVQSFVEVQIRFDAHTEFEAAVLAHPAVVECHTTAGESDYMLKIFARSADHLDELLRHNLSKLPGVQRLKTVVCLKTIKRHGHLAEWARTTEGRAPPFA